MGEGYCTQPYPCIAKRLFPDSNPWPTSHQGTTLPLHQGSPSIFHYIYHKKILVQVTYSKHKGITHEGNDLVNKLIRCGSSAIMKWSQSSQFILKSERSIGLSSWWNWKALIVALTFAKLVAIGTWELVVMLMCVRLWIYWRI